MKKISGELYRIIREKKYKKYMIIIAVSAVCCFASLVFFEKEMGDFSREILHDFGDVFSGITSYNFGFFKIWNIKSGSLSSIKDVFDAIITSGNIALLTGLFSVNYAYSFRHQTGLFMEVCSCTVYEITMTLVITEVIIANMYTLMYEMCLWIICVIYGMFHQISFGMTYGFGLWSVCLHINVTAFVLFVAMIVIIAKSRQAAMLICVSLVLAGNSCINLLKVFFNLPASIDKIWILNNIMFLPIDEMNGAKSISVILVAIGTCVLSIGLIMLEISLNSKERYR